MSRSYGREFILSPPDSSNCFEWSDASEQRQTTLPAVCKQENASSKSRCGPTLRKNALRLETNFHKAMRALDDRGCADDGIEEFSTCRSKVASAFAERKFVEEAIVQNGEGTLTAAWWQQSQESLAASLYERKWVQHTTTELEEQVTICCAEHGRLLTELAKRSDIAFERVSRLQSDALWQLDSVLGELGTCREASSNAEERHRRELEALKEQHRTKMNEMRERHEKELADRDSAERESQDQVARMGETMRTLNNLFKDIQHNAEGMSRADLRDRLCRAQVGLKEAYAELAELRPLRRIAGRVPILQGELRLAREDATLLRETLAEKDAVLADLMAKEASRLREEEIDAQNANNNKADADEDVMKFETLCARCKKSLDDVANIRAAVEGNPPPPRLICHGYRVLLPNIGGYRPQRSTTWVRRCMRAIFHAAILENVRTVGNRYPRFPEFAYSFFEPKRAELEKLKMVDRRKIIAEADDDRWGLYYGAKMLAKESDEAKLFWALLDETHGADFLAFTLYSLATVRKVAGASLRVQVGCAWQATFHTELRKRVEQFEVDADRLSSVRLAPAGSIWDKLASLEDQDALAFGGQQSLWISLDDALQATQQILLKANAKLRNAALDATRAVAVESEGRLDKWIVDVKHRCCRAAPANNSGMCVDLALWLRVVTHLFREEQAHRRAAVRLMFETALAGTITKDAPDYGTGREPVPRYRMRIEPHEPTPTVDLPQFVSIVRTLWPAISTVQACFLFREAHQSSNGAVDYEVFLNVADKFEFFTASLSLPHCVTAMPDFPMPERDRTTLGAAVHIHLNMMRPVLDRVMDALPDATRSALAASRHRLDAVIDISSTKATGGLEEDTSVERRLTSKGGVLPSIDGISPFIAYRRLLAEVADVRMLSYELGQDFLGGSGDGAPTPYRKWEENPSTFLLTALHEMTNLERILMNCKEDSRWLAIDKLQRRVAVDRIALAWRRKVASTLGPPLAVRLQMRRGYLSGRGEICSRRAFMPPIRLLRALTLLYEERIFLNDAVATPLSLAHFVHASYVGRFGVPSIAERGLQDLFYNARHFSDILPRARVFCILTGVADIPRYRNDKKIDDQEAKTGLSKEESYLFEHPSAAATFYIKAATIVGKLCRTQKSDDTDSNLPLFPTTHTTGEGINKCVYWCAPIDILENAAHQLFDGLDQYSTDLEVLLGEVHELGSLSSNPHVVNVDTFLYVCLRNWARAMAQRTKTAADLVQDCKIQSVTSLERLRTSLGNGADMEIESASLIATKQIMTRNVDAARQYSLSIRDVEGSKRGHQLNLLRTIEGGLETFILNVVTTPLPHNSRQQVQTEEVLGVTSTTTALISEFFCVWDAYRAPIGKFLDAFDAEFPHGDESDFLEDARSVVSKTSSLVEAYRAEVANKQSLCSWQQYTSVLAKFAALRSCFDAIHHLRGIQVRHLASRINTGAIDIRDIHDENFTPATQRWNTVAVAAATWEFVYDDWTTSPSSSEVRPVNLYEEANGS